MTKHCTEIHGVLIEIQEGRFIRLSVEGEVFYDGEFDFSDLLTTLDNSDLNLTFEQINEIIDEIKGLQEYTCATLGIAM